MKKLFNFIFAKQKRRKTQNRKLLEEEYDQSLELYKELKEWFVSSYDKRLEGLVLEDVD
ncbi:hypothetical protein SAG0135_01110 [Streptococcus agalactiae LMG 14609]|uniref:hypothetical protein n=1 Tax=Streptococcus agalactiae TaxID=1311 RepID=UPI0002DEF5AF|nr:hypothetical protein [Streptococcus agalactiae]EPU20699.1 hypothetical protein SAG0135_01110 [Streptococcus agalactiae LMG 14609]EPU24513.1 hypothetical protein SAG0137_11205 [Streptococcus agalactiae LMG 14838]